MDTYYRERSLNLLVWRSFTRSIGIFVTGILTVITNEPLESLGKGLVVWLFFYLIRQLDTNFVDKGIWAACSTCFYFASLWVSKIIVIIISTLVSIRSGASIEEVILVLGGLLIYDLYFVIIYGG